MVAIELHVPIDFPYKPEMGDRGTWYSVDVQWISGHKCQPKERCTLGMNQTAEDSLVVRVFPYLSDHLEVDKYCLSLVCMCVLPLRVIS